jgi:hypothetical protein
MTSKAQNLNITFKINKTSAPIRPMIKSIQAPSYKTEKCLSKKTKELTLLQNKWSFYSILIVIVFKYYSIRDAGRRTSFPNCGSSWFYSVLGGNYRDGTQTRLYRNCFLSNLTNSSFIKHPTVTLCRLDTNSVMKERSWSNSGFNYIKKWCVLFTFVLLIGNRIRSFM